MFTIPATLLGELGTKFFGTLKRLLRIPVWLEFFESEFVYVTFK